MPTTCLCPACSPDNIGPTYTPEYRLACEAREVLRWPLERRRQYLAARAVQGRRGELEAALIVEHRKARTAA